VNPSMFHLLRPWWLMALLPSLLIVVALRRQGSVAFRWRGVIAPHLLEHLILRPPGARRLRPLHGLVAALVISTIAMAGPTWRRIPSPFAEETAPLVIALDLSETMLVEDIQPSRLERARHKIRDLSGGRSGARTALLAYAGSAHMVMPLTDDPAVIAAYVDDLEPSLMPVAGKKPAAALTLAQEMLADETTPGTILFLSDGIAVDALPAFEEHARARRDQVVVLAVATAAGGPVPGTSKLSALDRGSLEALSSRAGAWVVTVTVDDADVDQVVQRMASHLRAVQQEDLGDRWRDEGWWLVFPLAAITLLWFRKGWLVEWEG
jgi:Ca-activated chloride channel family protein